MASSSGTSVFVPSLDKEKALQAADGVMGDAESIFGANWLTI